MVWAVVASQSAHTGFTPYRSAPFVPKGHSSSLAFRFLMAAFLLKNTLNFLFFRRTTLMTELPAIYSTAITNPCRNLFFLAAIRAKFSKALITTSAYPIGIFLFAGNRS